MAKAEWLSRKEAAKYLTDIGYPIAAHSLANMAINNNAGKGPAFYTMGWRTVKYRKADLDKWVSGRVKRVY